MPLNLYESVLKPSALWESNVAAAVGQSLQRAQRLNIEEYRAQWQALHGYLMGVHRQFSELKAKALYPERAKEWAEGNGASWRFFELVRMLVDRLSVCFARPPETYLHRGDGVRLPEDDPQVRQWRLDEEAAELDTTLRTVDEWTTGMSQSFVSPSWVRDHIEWVVLAPYEVFVDQDLANPRSLSTAQSVSVQLRQPEDSLSHNEPTLFQTWVRRESGSSVSWEYYLHDQAGKRLLSSPLFPKPEGNRNPYGLHPLVLWQVQRPAGGEFWVPPNETWVQEQSGIDVSLTDLQYGVRYQIHPQWVQLGMTEDEARPTFGPGRVVRFPEANRGDLRVVTPNLNLAEYRATIEWSLRMLAVSASLPADTFAPTAARNLAALQEQRHDLQIRREKAVPVYQRALRRTFEVHKKVGNYWARQPGVDRVVYDDDIRLGVQMAPLPEVQDRWQEAQSVGVEIQQGRTSPVEEIMRREGVSRAEAERRATERQNANEEFPTGTGTTPAPATAGGGQPRPASVERG